jgi:hypothetical protein
MIKIADGLASSGLLIDPAFNALAQDEFGSSGSLVEACYCRIFRRIIELRQ